MKQVSDKIPQSLEQFAKESSGELSLRQLSPIYTTDRQEYSAYKKDLAVIIEDKSFGELVQLVSESGVRQRQSRKFFSLGKVVLLKNIVMSNEIVKFIKENAFILRVDDLSAQTRLPVIQNENKTGIRVRDAINYLFPNGFPENLKGTNEVKICVLDTFCDTAHPRFTGNALLGPNFSGDVSGQDNTGHGTHVGGIIHELTKAEITFCQVLDGMTGSGTMLSWLEGMKFVKDKNFDILNLSLAFSGLSSDGESIPSRVTAELSDTTFICNAAGNSGEGGPGTIEVPADSKGIGLCAVGAISKSGELASFSSQGPTTDGRIAPTLVAPGVSILSYRSRLLPDNGEKDDLIAYSGTSMATPMIAGLAALRQAEELKRSNRKLTSTELKEALLKCCEHRKKEE